MFCQMAYFTTSQMPCSCQNLQGEFYFVKCPEGSKVTQEYCHTVAMNDTVLFKCEHQKDTGNLNILFLRLTHRMPGYCEISNFWRHD